MSEITRAEDRFLYEFERWMVDFGYRVEFRTWSEDNPDCVNYQISRDGRVAGFGFVPGELQLEPIYWAAQVARALSPVMSAKSP
jgi:hypothetical protein